MKISKNELRKMIFETVLREQEEVDVQGTGAGARKTRAPDDEETGTLKSDIEKQVKKIVSKIAKEDSFKGMITIGRMRTEVTRAEPKELGKKIKRALETDVDLKNYKESLKVGRAFKIAVSKEKNDAPVANAEENDDRAEPESKQDPEEYGPISNKDPYIYKVNKETGCWETKKKGSQGAWISLKNNVKATNTLDAKYTDARTAEDKAKCTPSASKKGTPAQGAQGTNLLTKAVNAAIDNNILSVTTTNQVPALNSEVGLNVAFNVSDLQMLGGALGKDSYPDDKGYLIIKKQKSGPGGPDNLIVGAAVLQVKENGTDVLYLGPNNETKGSQIYSEIKLSDFEGEESTWGANLIAPNILQKIINFLNLESVNESFGKSHATLIRERYWGRY